MKKPLSDAEYVKQIRERRDLRISAAINFGLSIELAFIGAKGQADKVFALFSPQDFWLGYVAAGLLILALVLYGMSRPFQQIADRAFLEKLELRRSDDHQRKRTRYFWLFPICLACLLPGVLETTDSVLTKGFAPYDLMSFGLAGLLIAANTAMLYGWFYSRKLRAVIVDEMTQASLRRAHVIGYWAVLFGGFVAFILGLGNPAQAVKALPIVLLTGALVPSFSFAVLDWRADRDD